MSIPEYHVAGVPQGAQTPYHATVATPVVGMNGVGAYRPLTNEESLADMAVMGLDAAGGLVSKAAAPVAALSGAASVVGTSLQNQREEKILLDLYRDTVAASIGIPPEQVTLEDLRQMAEHSPEHKHLREELEKLDERSITKPVRSVVTTAAAVGGGILGAIPGLGIGSAATGLAGSIAASKAADSIMDGMIGEERDDTVFDAIKQIDAKVQSKDGVSPLDLFALHVAADEGLALQIKGHMGDDFGDLPSDKQARTMLRDHPRLTELCRYEAYLINAGALPPASLMDERVQVMVRERFEHLQAQAQPTPRIMTGGHQVSPLAPQSQIVAGQPGAFSRAVTQQREQAAMQPSETSIQ